jgi:hypothetical protein
MRAATRSCCGYHTVKQAQSYGDDGKHFVVHADEKLTVFLELESAIRACGELPRQVR